MSEGVAAGPACASPRIFQIHPSLACNLQCRHCYSESGPWQKAALPLDVLQAAVRDAADAGYDVLAISGGEPLLYPHVVALLETARDAGMRTSLTTNGTLLARDRLARVAPHLDLLAISLDGPREIHDRIRGSPTAFARLEAGLGNVREAGVAFGFIHTLTSESWEHVPWLARFAADAGASLLQLHPLELTGRASDMGNVALTQDDLCRAYLLALLHGDAGVPIQFDAYHVEQLQEEPEVVYAGPAANGQVRLIVLEADGTVLPLSSGLSHAYAVGNVLERSLKESLADHASGGDRAFRALSRAVLRGVLDEGLALTAWNERLAAASHAAALSPTIAAP